MLNVGTAGRVWAGFSGPLLSPKGTHRKSGFIFLVSAWFRPCKKRVRKQEQIAKKSVPPGRVRGSISDKCAPLPQEICGTLTWNYRFLIQHGHRRLVRPKPRQVIPRPPPPPPQTNNQKPKNPKPNEASLKRLQNSQTRIKTSTLNRKPKGRNVLSERSRSDPHIGV